MFLSFRSEAQFTLEYTYYNAAIPLYFGSQQRLFMVNLEVDGMKYVFQDLHNKNIHFYNPDHSWWKTISLLNATDLNPSSNLQGIIYISQLLFDNDNEVELLYSDQGNGNCVTDIINEDGSVIFNVQGQGPWVLLQSPQSQMPIYNTPTGTKMILSSCANGGAAYVYALSGTLTENIIADHTAGNTLSASYPNPAVSGTRIDYSLPKSISKAMLWVTDQRSNVIRSYEISGKEKFFNIPVHDLSAGIYHYFITAENTVIKGNKFVVIR